MKIVAPDLEKAIAGSRLLVVGPDDDEEEMMDEIMSDLTTLLNSIDKSGRGVCVQASTLGSLEALLDFLKVSKIPVSGINIGPVHKKDIMRAATMLEKAKELACILCFDVTVDKDAERLAEEMGIRLFKGNFQMIICVFWTILTFQQLTSSTTCLMPSLLTMLRSWRLNVGMRPRKRCGLAVSKRSLASLNVSPSSLASIFWMELCALVPLYVW